MYYKPYKKRNNTGKIIATILLIVVTVCIILALAGVQPLSNWKDSIKAYIGGLVEETNVNTKQVANIKQMYVSYVLSRTLTVLLEPTSYAVASQNYTVELYENGVFRDKTYISWNQPEINVKKEKYVHFSVTREEFSAYFNENIHNIFSVKIY